MATPKQTKISSFFSSSPSSALDKKKRSVGKENIAEEAQEEEAQEEEESAVPKKKLKIEEDEGVARDEVIKKCKVDKDKELNAVEVAAAEADAAAEGATEATPEKKPKSESSAAVCLSPEQRDKMAQNKMAAKLKLLTSKTNGLVTNFGASWLPTLEPEFSKDYFLKLSQFVASGRSGTFSCLIYRFFVGVT